MLNLLQADLYKLTKSLSIKILFILSTACAAAMTLFAYLIPQERLDAGLAGVGFMFSDVNVISILGAVMASIIICGDLENKTIHDAIANGSSRSTIMISKAVLLGLCLVLLLLPYSILTGIALSTGSEYSMGSVAIGFLNLLTAESGTVFTAAKAWKVVAVMITLIIVYIGQLSICVPLAFWLKKPVFVIAIYYALSILTGQLMNLSNSSSVFDQLFSLTPYGGNHVFLTVSSGSGEMVKAILVSLVFFIMMVAVTYSSFRKAEIK